MLTQGVAQGWELLGFQPVPFSCRFPKNCGADYLLISSLFHPEFIDSWYAVCLNRNEWRIDEDGNHTCTPVRNVMTNAPIFLRNVINHAPTGWWTVKNHDPTVFSLLNAIFSNSLLLAAKCNDIGGQTQCYWQPNSMQLDDGLNDFRCERIKYLVFRM